MPTLTRCRMPLTRTTTRYADTLVKDVRGHTTLPNNATRLSGERADAHSATNNRGIGGHGNLRHQGVRANAPAHPMSNALHRNTFSIYTLASATPKPCNKVAAGHTHFRSETAAE